MGTLLNFNVLDEKGAMNLDLGGGAVARINDDTGYKYTVAEKTARISWVWPGKTINETWRVGDMPICPLRVPENTREIKYDIPQIVPVESSATYTLKIAQNFETKISAELGMSYSINFYVSEINFKSLSIGDASYTMRDAKIVEVDGKTYYKFNTGPISATGSVNSIQVLITLQSAFGEKQYRYDLNLLTYLDGILSGTYSYDTYRLALSVLGCIKSQLPEGYTNRVYNNIAKKYNTDTVLSEIKGSGTDLSAVSSAIRSVTVVNENGIAYRLSLNSAFSGEIKAVYTLGGKECTDTFKIVSGKYSNKAYVDIVTDAAAFAEGFKIFVGDAGVSIDAELCKSQTNGVTADQLAAIYAYSVEVKKYVNGSKEG